MPPHPSRLGTEAAGQNTQSFPERGLFAYLKSYSLRAAKFVFLFNTNLAANCNSLQRWGGWPTPSLNSPSDPFQVANSLKKKKLVHTSGALASVAATQRKHSLIAWLWWPEGLVFTRSMGL